MSENQTQEALRWLVQVMQDNSLVQTAAFAGYTSLPVLYIPDLPYEIQRRLEEDVAIALSRSIQQPTGDIRVLELCGRVVKANVWPVAIPDPVVPIVLVNLGERYQRDFARFVRYMAGWQHGITWSLWPRLMPNAWHGRKWRMARPLIDELVRLAVGSGKLSEDELVYFKRQLALCLAAPDRQR